MDFSPLTAISPVDGRYQQQTGFLQAYFSEYALIKYRIAVEIKYLLFLAEKKFIALKPPTSKHLLQLSDNFSTDQAREIKKIEATTNHDIKAVEYFLKQELEKTTDGKVKEWIHFGLTSQDVNNTAIPMLWRDCMEQEYLPAIVNLQQHLHRLARQWKAIPMLAKTHGQPASPTLLGKELMVFTERLQNQVALFAHIPYAAKFGGATGNLNAHRVAFPKTNWISFANEFVEQKLGLQRMQFTTQIEHYDNLAAHFDCIKRINNILTDLCRDVWTYISMDYFKQKTKAGEVGSSAMPHKVNPIDFENAEGNLGIANAMLEQLSAKLPISRLQRDLTDSTVLRNMGVPVAHTFIAIRSIEKGLDKLVLNAQKLHEDLESNWAVVAEAIQTILRRENYPEPYEALKALTRGKAAISQNDITHFIDSLQVKEQVKKELRNVTPHNYVGVTTLF